MFSKCFWHLSDFPWEEDFASWPEGRILWLERVAWGPGTLFLSFRFFVFSSSFFPSSSLGRYYEVTVEACPSGVFSSTLKPLELEIFIVDGQGIFYLHLFLLCKFISSSIPLYRMQLESPLFLLESLSKATWSESWKERKTDEVCFLYLRRLDPNEKLSRDLME